MNPNIDIVTALALIRAASLASDEQIKELGVSRQEIHRLGLSFIDQQAEQMLGHIARNALRTYLIGRNAPRPQAANDGAEAAA